MLALPALDREIEVDRDDTWLVAEMERLLATCFRDVPRKNAIEIRFGRPWKTRLGRIRLSEPRKVSQIEINALLGRPEVPEAVCRVTVAHELVHYSHGFGSTLPRRHRHPHQGHIVSRALVARGLGAELAIYNQWTDQEWYRFYEEQTRVRRILRVAR